MHWVATQDALYFRDSLHRLFPADSRAFEHLCVVVLQLGILDFHGAHGGLRSTMLVLVRIVEAFAIDRLTES